MFECKILSLIKYVSCFNYIMSIVYLVYIYLFESYSQCILNFAINGGGG